MKANKNIKQLKKWMVNRSTDKIECYICGVQAYNISANEYEVIVAYQKISGRYYFIDRDGNKYLASRYDRAEQVAGDIVEIDLFLEFSAAIGLEFEVKGNSNGENEKSTVTYILMGNNKTAEQQNEETAAACEPSKFAGILAKAKNGARKVCEKVALIMALAFVMAT